MITIEAGRRWVGMQLPIQARSRMFAQPWESQAGPGDMMAVAATCERAGFDYLGVCDHVAIPAAAAEAMGTHWCDPITTLAWIAGQTQRIRLLTHVYVLPLRPVRVAAKEMSTLDHLSGGRLVIGVGAGHLRDEFELVGADFERRGAILNDQLPQLATLLEHEFVDGLGAAPRPAQSPRPPIWVAGSSRAAIARAARLADGWLPQGPATAELVDELRRGLDVAGRDDASFAIGHIAAPLYLGEPGRDLGRSVLSGSADKIAERLLDDLAPGVNQIQLRFVASSLGECLDQHERAGEELLPLLR